MSQLTAYLNGEYIPAKDCKISVMDIGITTGASVTDMVRTFNQKPFRLEEHITRFFNAAKHSYLTIPHTKEEVSEISRRLIEINSKEYPEYEFALCYYVTPGVSYLYAGSAAPAEGITPTFCVHAFPLPFSLWKDNYINGVKIATASVAHIPPQCITPSGKHRNRLHMHVAGGMFDALGINAMPIFLDTNGNITETGGSNFVIYKNGAIYSPKRRNILWGISLQTLKEIVEKMGIPFIEEDIMVYDAVTADEAFVTTTPYCLAPVSHFNGQVIGSGKDFHLFHKILKAWGEIVCKDLWAEITEANPIVYK